MSDDSADQLVRETEAARGYLNPGHRHLAAADPEFMRTYNQAVGIALKHGERELDTDDLEAKYRELVVCALLAFRGEAESAIAGHLRRAMRLGATEKEAVGAFEAAFVPGGAPTLLTGMRVLAGMRRGEY